MDLLQFFDLEDAAEFSIEDPAASRCSSHTRESLSLWILQLYRRDRAGERDASQATCLKKSFIVIEVLEIFHKHLLKQGQQYKWPHIDTTASFAMSKQMLHTNIESSFFSSSSLRSGFVDVLLFSGDGLKEYCVEERNSEVSLVDAVGSESGRSFVVDDDI